MTPSQLTVRKVFPDAVCVRNALGDMWLIKSERRTFGAIGHGWRKESAWRDAAVQVARNMRTPRICYADDCAMNRWIGMREWRIPTCHG